MIDIAFNTGTTDNVGNACDIGVAGNNGKSEKSGKTVNRADKAGAANPAKAGKKKQARFNKKDYPKFSVATSVYGKDNAEWFDRALESIIVKQTVKPDEVVLVVDGPVPEEIQSVIDKYSRICSEEGGISLKAVYLLANKGLGNALLIAVKRCSNELVARMDSDDIAVLDRFEQQINYFLGNPSIDIVGGDIDEFIGDINHVTGKRRVPRSDSEIKKYIKKRCPFNHVTVMYKKSAVQKAGGYRDWFWNEDYYLWLRMYLTKAVFANTGTILVHVRAGEQMYQRRGGMKYFRSEMAIQSYMKDNKIIGTPTYIMNCAKRLVLQILLPNKVRGWVFRKFARSQ